jgi:hypothetical protein
METDRKNAETEEPQRLRVARINEKGLGYGVGLYRSLQIMIIMKICVLSLRIIKSSNHQISIVLSLKNYQIIKSPNYQINQSISGRPSFI